MKIKEVLKRYKLTLKELADALGLSRPTLNSYIDQFEKDEKISNNLYQYIFTQIFNKEWEDRSQILEEIKHLKNSLAHENKSLEDEYCKENLELIESIKEKMYRDMKGKKEVLPLYKFINSVLYNYNEDSGLTGYIDYNLYLNSLKDIENIEENEKILISNIYPIMANHVKNNLKFNEKGYSTFIKRMKEIQKIREEERKVVFDKYFEKEKDIVTGVVQRYVGKNISINLGRADAMLTENEQVKGEHFKPTERIKLYVVEVKNTPKGPKILVSRTHPELVKRLFEAEVAEVRDGTVEIKSIAREAGSRTKMAVWSNDPNVDPVGACVGMNGARVNAVVQELRGEKIDIINWDENPALLIENSLSPAKVISVMADPEEKIASVIVPDYQLSLAIGEEGQNARLAARLTGYKIDIKSETQAIEAGELPENYMEEMGLVGEEGYTGDYEEEYNEEYSEESYDEAAEDQNEESEEIEFIETENE